MKAQKFVPDKVSVNTTTANLTGNGGIGLLLYKMFLF